MVVDHILNFFANNPAWVIFVSVFLPLGAVTVMSGALDKAIGTPGKHQRVRTSVPVEMDVPLKVRDKFDFDKVTHYYNTV